MRLSAGVFSDRGRVRPANEDSFLVRPGLYAVCDGMGGARAGEVASQMACSGMLSVDPATAGHAELRRAVFDANAAIIEQSTADDHLLGMGTTLTAALLKEGVLTVAHIGDSRAYLFRQGDLTQLTEDHSWVGEMVRRGELTPDQAASHPHRSVITRALGTEEGTDPDVFEAQVLAGDRILVCSDGLTGMVSDEAISQILAEGLGSQETAEALVKAALDGGGEDNVTVVVVDVEDEATGSGDGKEATGPDADTVLVGPADRGAATQRSKRVGAAVRERLGRRTIPEARPIGQTLVARSPGESVDEGGPESAPAAPPSADLSTSAGDKVPSEPAGTPAPKETPHAASALQPTATPAGDLAPAVNQTPAAAAAPERSRRRKKRLVWALIVVLVIALAVAGLAWYNSTVYYVGTTDDGKVALFNGLPAAVLGIELSSVYEQSTVDFGDLSSHQQEQVNAHERVSKEEGQLFLRTLSAEQ